MLRTACHTYGDGHAQQDAPIEKDLRVSYCCTSGFRELTGAVLVRIGQEHQELVPSPPPDLSVTTYNSLQAARDLDQDSVPVVVIVGVVHLLEAVQIEKEEAKDFGG
jgi:hypothetical protein